MSQEQATISKSRLIRMYLKEFPDRGPKWISQRISADYKVQIKPNFVSAVKQAVKREESNGDDVPDVVPDFVAERRVGGHNLYPVEDTGDGETIETPQRSDATLSIRSLAILCLRAALEVLEGDE